MFQQELAPLGSLTVSALVALLPLLTIFVLLGGLRWKAHWAGLAALAVAVLVAVIAYGMPVGLAVLSATEGAVFGLFPIMWTVVRTWPSAPRRSAWRARRASSSGASSAGASSCC